MSPSRLADTLSLFPDAARTLLESALNSGAFLPAHDVEQLGGILGISIEELMIKLLPIAAAFAVVPVSSYPVGVVAQGMAALVGGWASLYFGANFEFAGEALSFSVHGEQSAMSHAWAHGEPGLQAVAISAAPCGYCRQFLWETSTRETFNVLLQTKTGHSKALLSTFLPDAFGPEDLEIDGGLMDPKFMKQGLTLRGGSTDPLVLAALGAANDSYAPYTRNFAGCAVQTEDGSSYSGRYAENAAYNPSMSPLEAALSFMNMSRQPTGSRTITRAVLVEAPTKASQKAASEAVLASYAPELTLGYEVASGTA